MSLLSKESAKGEKSWHGHNFSPFEILETVVLEIAHEKCKKIMMRDEKREDDLVPAVKSKSYLYFMGPKPRPSRTSNTAGPSSPEEERKEGEILEREIPEEGEILEEEELRAPRNKKRPHCHIQEIPNLVDEPWLPFPKKPRSSPSPSSHSTISQKSSPASTTASNESDHLQKPHPKIISRIEKPFSPRRKLYDEMDDDHGQDHWAAPNKKKMEKKMEKVVIKNSNKGKRVKFAKDSIVTPDLPEEFRELIVGAMNGTRLQLLIQKTIYESDIKKDQGRLLLPREQTSSKTFLKRNETRRLKGTNILQVPLINPMFDRNHVVITLGWWKMSSKSKLSYILKSAWNDVVEQLGLCVRDVVQVWSFRARNSKYVVDDEDEDDDDEDDGEGVNHLPDDEQGQLHMAIVVVKKGESAGSNGGSCSPGNDGTSNSD